ncbi:hypothetical protein MWH30_06385 [Fuchsiella alkaliacetigena]|nr:hypothetical protein [Fuchsiella alkaliacetigena]
MAKMYYHTGRYKATINVLDRYLDMTDAQELRGLKEKLSKEDFRRLKSKYL